MSEIEGYTPPEARPEAKTDTPNNKHNLQPETIKNIQERSLQVGAYEKPEVQRTPDKQPEKQGDTIKQSFNNDPNISGKGQQALQGYSDIQGNPPDHSFFDRHGRDISMRTYKNGDSYMIRAYDRPESELPERRNPGQAGWANLRIEQDEQQVRGRLQDIETPDSYKESGIGSEMLAKAESICRQHQAAEIYGLAPSDKNIRSWYERRGFGFRRESQGEQIFKKL